MGLFQQSRIEGLQEGLQQGEATALLRLMDKKFGAPGTDVRSKIESADSETLLHWLDNILTAEKVDEVFH